MDKFDVHAWKLSQLITEGKGKDLATDIISKMRESFRSMSDDEVDDFKRTMLEAMLLPSELEMIYPPKERESEVDMTEEDYKNLSEEELNEKLCPKGQAYRKKRLAAGEVNSAYLNGRAVQVCQGKMKG